MRSWIIQLSIRDSYGREHTRDRAIPIQIETVGRRAVDDLKAGFVGLDNGIATMRVRQLRRDVIMQAAKQLAAQIADEIEDAEGWHGPHRMEAFDARTGARYKHEMD